MQSPAPTREPARSPDELHRRRQDAINHADLAGYLAIHDDDAVVVVPTDGATARGHDAIGAAMSPLFALRPRLTTTVVNRLETVDLALAHHRWRLSVTEDGARCDLSGLGTTVSRRRPDGSWRLVMDDLFTGT